MSAADNQTNNLYSEDDFLRNAAGKNFRAKGFDRKAYNKIFGGKSEKLSDSATGHSIPAGYYNLDDSFSGSGAMPPPGGSYYQTGNTATEPAVSKGVLTEMIDHTIKNIKTSIYRIYTQTLPVLLRDYITTKINNFSKLTDVLSSLYLMGVDGGPIERIEQDWRDRLELIVDEDDRLLAIRRYTDRKVTPFIKMLREGVVKPGDSLIPLGGVPITSLDQIIFTNEGQIQGFKKEVGGKPITLDEVLRIDPYYESSRTLSLLTHGDSDKGNLGAFTRNFPRRTIANTIYNTEKTKAKRRPLEGTVPGTGKVTVIDYEWGYWPNSFDIEDFIDGLSLAFTGRIFHKFYDTLEKIYERAGLAGEAKRVRATEYDRFGLPEKDIIPRFAYA